MKVKKNQKLSDYTTIGIGGSVPAVYLPESEQELVDLLTEFANEKRAYRVLGNGSNILADDGPFSEVIICTKQLQRIFQVDPPYVTVDSGYPVAQLAYQTAAKGLAGLEFAVGIPGSIGGVVRMNAGAHQQMIGGVVDSVRMVLPGGHVVEANHEELRFSYRSSAIPPDAILMTVRLKLHPAPSSEIHARVKQYNAERTASQPLKEKSAGCIFKNPEKSSAGKLIEDSGLKGFRIGGAVVSEMHANFIVNRGHATFQDALDLIQYIKKTVRSKQATELQEEVILWRPE